MFSRSRFHTVIGHNPPASQQDTAPRHRPRLCIASRGKNRLQLNELFYTCNISVN